MVVVAIRGVGREEEFVVVLFSLQKFDDTGTVPFEVGVIKGSSERWNDRPQSFVQLRLHVGNPHDNGLNPSNDLSFTCG